MYKIKDGIEIEIIDEEVILLDTIEGRFININKSGLFILNSIMENKEINEIIASISSKSNQDVNVIENIVNQYILELLESNIIDK